MTCYLTLQFCDKYHLKVYITVFGVSRVACLSNGTTANLFKGDSLNICELLHGIMQLRL